jgi:hypothetical protein
MIYEMYSTQNFVSWASSDWYQLPAIEKEIEQSHEQENNQN